MLFSIAQDNFQAPFLRWTGSKRWFTKDHVEEFLPKQFNSYHEPFLGGGAVFFYLRNCDNHDKRSYYLSDSNEELINCYLQLQTNKTRVIKYLSSYINTEDDYYVIRDSNPSSQIQRAARFIYLNRTSFNGIYRVNSFGKYNVPYGRRNKVDIVTPSLFDSVNKALKDVVIETQSFEKTIKNVKKGDLVFLDPPYTVAHENNGFIEYNQKLFSWDDQLKLKQFIQKIINQKAFFILTNASHESIIDLYSDIGKVSKLSRLSKVGGRNKTRGMYNELIIYNTKL
jgi:DNA adenine methylase